MNQSSQPGRYVFDDRLVRLPVTDADGYQAERRGVTPHQGFPGDARALQA